MENKKFKRLGIIGRFKPLHLGGFRLLEEACKQAEHVVIGIGSCNKYNVRNPFTAQESEDMIRSSLNFDNYEIIPVPDFAHILGYRDGKKWAEFVKENFKVDYFISGNEYVRELLTDTFPLIYPGEIVPREKWIKLRASEVRLEIARFGDWKKFVSGPIADYLEKNDLIERFRNEFGLKTIASLSGIGLRKDENLDEEKLHPMEV